MSDDVVMHGRIADTSNPAHRHSSSCVHNETPERQVHLRGHTVAWWTGAGFPMPVQIRPADWAD